MTPEVNVSDENKRKISVLKGIPFFQPFTEEELALLLRESQWLKCNSGDKVFSEGDTDSAFYVVLAGSVAVRKKGAGLFNLGTLGKGDCFGEMSVITGEPRSAEIIANQETYIIKIDGKTLDTESDNCLIKSIQLKFYRIFARILSSRLGTANNQLVQANRSKWR